VAVRALPRNAAGKLLRERLGVPSERQQ
jgi:hypothetical protein